MFLFLIIFLILIIFFTYSLGAIYFYYFVDSKNELYTNLYKKMSYVNNIFSTRNFIKLSFEKSYKASRFMHFTDDLYFYDNNYITDIGVPFLDEEQYQIAQMSYGFHTISFLKNLSLYIDGFNSKNDFVFTTLKYNNFLIFKCNKNNEKTLVTVINNQSRPTEYLEALNLNVLNNVFPLGFYHSGYYSSLIYSENGEKIRIYQSIGRLTDSINICSQMDNKEVSEFLVRFVKFINDKDSKYFSFVSKLEFNS